jgi:hypothetical protein
MNENEKLGYIARVLAVLVGFRADADRTAEWLETLLAADSTHEDLEEATVALVDSMNQRHASARALAQRAIDLARQKRGG